MAMDWQPMIDRAYGIPALRQRLLNPGQMTLYSDYAGDGQRERCGIACCIVHDGRVRVAAEERSFARIGDSVYGELVAVAYSLEQLREALSDHPAKVAVLFTDCSSVSRIVVRERRSKMNYTEIGGRIDDLLIMLSDKFPQVRVHVRYIGNRKRGNVLHEIAHVAARRAIGK